MRKISLALSNKLANMAFVCSVFIVCIHTTIDANAAESFLWYFKYYFTLSGIVSVAVPFFFIASGFFLAGHMNEKGWYKNAISKRLKSLGIPYVFWNLFYFFFLLSLVFIGAKINVPFGDMNEYQMTPVRISEIFGLNPFVTPELPFLWYVRALVIFVVASPLIRRMAGWGVALFFMLYFATDVLWNLPASWSKLSHWFISLRGLAYFSLGIYFRNKPICLENIRKKGIPFVSLVLGSVVYLYGLRMSIQFPGVVSRGLIWSGVPVMLLAVWTLVPEKKWPVFFTRCSFPIFLMQSALITLTIGALRVCSLKEWGYTTIYGFLIRLVVVVGAGVVMTNLLYKFFPRFSRLVFGGRG